MRPNDYRSFSKLLYILFKFQVRKSRDVSDNDIEWFVYRMNSMIKGRLDMGKYPDFGKGYICMVYLVRLLDDLLPNSIEDHIRTIMNIEIAVHRIERRLNT